MSDRRAAARLLGGLDPIFPTIKTVIADAGHQSRKLTRLIKAEGYELRIVKRRKRAFEVVGLTWIVERTFAWIGWNNVRNFAFLSAALSQLRRRSPGSGLGLQ